MRRLVAILLVTFLTVGLCVGPAMASQEELVEYVYQYNLSVKRPALIESDQIFYHISPTIQSLSDEIVGSERDPMKQIRAIHDWICKNIYYDWDYFEKRTTETPIEPDEVVSAKRTVCSGFSKLFQALVNAQDIPCMYVSGTALGAGTEGVWTAQTVNGSSERVVSHAWNEVYLNDRWILVDATWDCQNDYKNGVFQSGGMKTTYFDCTLKELSRNHRTAVYENPLKNMYCPAENGNLYFDHNGAVGGADKTVTAAVVPEGITAIGFCAFQLCDSLKSVTLPEGLTTIEDSAFFKCTSLSSVVLPASLDTIGNNAFGDCSSLTSVSIKNGTKNIADDAFEYTPWFERNQSKIVYNDDTNIPTGIPPQETAPKLIAQANPSAIYVDKVRVDFAAYQVLDEKGNATNYLKLRDVAYILNSTQAQFNISWDGATNSILLQTKMPYSSPTGEEMKVVFQGDQPYVPNASTVLVDGVAVDLGAITLMDAKGGAHTYFKIRDLGRALGFNVGWYGFDGAIMITSTEPYSGST